MIARPFINYVHASVEELKKVAWPTRKQVWNGTLLVVGMSVFLALYLGLLDYILNLGVENIIK